MNKIFLAIMLSIAAITCSAECYYSSASTATVNLKVDAMDEIKFIPTPGACTATVRVLYRGNWHSLAGHSNGDKSDTENCTDALNYAIKDFLLKQDGRDIKATQQMICTDLPVIKYKTVQMGDIIKASEVQPHPDRPRPFLYKGNSNECRFFIQFEPDRPGHLKPLNGVMCRVGRISNDEWYVLGTHFD